VQFRPIPALAQLVKPLADRQGLALNEAYKDLAALAIIGLDVRYFGLVSQMALAMGGTNSFVHGCLQLHSALRGAAIAGRPLSSEPARSRFVLEVVSDCLADKGLTVDTSGLWFLGQAEPAGTGEGQPTAPEAPEPPPAAKTPTRSTPRMRRNIRTGGLPYEDDDDL
jgi:hypothetical protein